MEVVSTKRLPSHFEYVLIESKKRKTMAKLPIRKNTKFCDKIRRQFPPYWSEYIKDAFDVLGDGHCGYRVISHALNIIGDWSQVRNDVHWELENRGNLYSQIFGRHRYDELLNSIKCIETSAPFDKWLTMPDMGLVISSCYNIALVQLSQVQNLTFLPLHSSMPATPTLVCIEFIRGNHFIHLTLTDCSPIPHIIPSWMRYHEAVAENWERHYKSRITNARTPSRDPLFLALNDVE